MLELLLDIQMEAVGGWASVELKVVFQETSGRENLGASIQHEDGI